MSSAVGVDAGSRDSDLVRRTVGPQPVVTVSMGGVTVDCLVDSGSQVSMIDEDFFRRNMGRSYTRDAGNWLEITAANGLSVPYAGLFVTDVICEGVTVNGSGIIVARRPPTIVEGRRVFGSLGTNILQHLRSYRHLVRAGDSSGFVRVAGRKDIMVPSNSRLVIAVTTPILGGRRRD